MMASHEEEQPVMQRAYVAYSNDPRVEGLTDDDPETDVQSTHLRARYDGEISIRTRVQDVKLFQHLADERDWSYGRMFQELLKTYGNRA